MSKLSLKLAAWVTLACALLEFVVGVSCQSMALTTDSGYMTTDACALFMAILAANDKRLRSKMMWFSAIMMLLVVFYMLAQSIKAYFNPPVVLGSGVLLVSAIGLVVNIWVSNGLVKMPDDSNIKVAHLHVICDMLGSAIAVVSGIMAAMGFAAKYDIILSIISAIGVGVATTILMYKMYLAENSSSLKEAQS